MTYSTHQTYFYRWNPYGNPVLLPDKFSSLEDRMETLSETLRRAIEQFAPLSTVDQEINLLKTRVQQLETRLTEVTTNQENRIALLEKTSQKAKILYPKIKRLTHLTKANHSRQKKIKVKLESNQESLDQQLNELKDCLSLLTSPFKEQKSIGTETIDLVEQDSSPQVSEEVPPKKPILIQKPLVKETKKPVPLKKSSVKHTEADSDDRVLEEYSKKCQKLPSKKSKTKPMILKKIDALFSAYNTLKTMPPSQ